MADSSSESGGSTVEYDTPPVRLGDDDEEDVVWLPGRDKPESELERYLLEKDFLSYILVDPVATADDKTKANAALKSRINNNIYGQALNNSIQDTISAGILTKLKSKHKDDEVIPTPTLGTDDTVSVNAFKEFAIASGSKTYSGPSAGKLNAGHLRQILEAASTVIQTYGLSSKAAFTLIRSSFKDEPLELLVLYEKNDHFQAFFRLVQLLSKSNTTPSQTLQEIIRLTNQRPATANLGAIFYKLLGLHEDLVSGLPASERKTAFQNSCRNNLLNYISIWYPGQIEAVNEKYAAFKLQADREVRQLKQQGKTAEALERQRMYCPVSSFIEAAMSILPFHTPVKAEDAPKKIHVAKVTDNDLPIGAEAASNWCDVIESEKQPQAQALPMNHGVNPFQQLPMQAMAAPMQGPLMQHMMPMQQPPYFYPQFPLQNYMSPQIMAMGAPPPQQQSAPMAPFQGVFHAPPSGGRSGNPQQQGMNHQGSGQPQQGFSNGRNGNGNRKNINGPKCPRCLRHALCDAQGRVLPCYRYPTLSPNEVNAKCNHCGGTHFSARCNEHLKLTQIYPDGRPDQAPAAQPQMFSNSTMPPQMNQPGPFRGRQNGPNGGYRQNNFNQEPNQGPAPGIGGPRERLRQPLPDPRIQGPGGTMPQQNAGYGGARPKQQNPF